MATFEVPTELILKTSVRRGKGLLLSCFHEECKSDFWSTCQESWKTRMIEKLAMYDLNYFTKTRSRSQIICSKTPPLFICRRWICNWKMIRKPKYEILSRNRRASLFSLTYHKISKNHSIFIKRMKSCNLGKLKLFSDFWAATLQEEPEANETFWVMSLWKNGICGE